VSESLKSVGAITLFVEDAGRSKMFYENVFGLPVAFEDLNSVVFKFDNLLVNLLKIQEAYGLIGPAAVAGPGSGSRFQFTIWVGDTDGVCAELAKRGVVLINGPVNREWGVRTASFADPDGHIWEVAQQLS
jgi:catechol 2,3-dioxygenase-like lactoylglutathione lyase family enzyme